MLRWGWLLLSHSKGAEQRVFQVPLKREIRALVTVQVNARGSAMCRIGPSLKQRDEQVGTRCHSHRVFVAKSDLFCALQACMDFSR